MIFTRSLTEIGYSHISRITNYPANCSGFPFFTCFSGNTFFIQYSGNLKAAITISDHFKHSLDYFGFSFKRNTFFIFLYPVIAIDTNARPLGHFTAFKHGFFTPSGSIPPSFSIQLCRISFDIKYQLTNF